MLCGSWWPCCVPGPWHQLGSLLSCVGASPRGWSGLCWQAEVCSRVTAVWEDGGDGLWWAAVWDSDPPSAQSCPVHPVIGGQPPLEGGPGTRAARPAVTSAGAASSPKQPQVLAQSPQALMATSAISSSSSPGCSCPICTLVGPGTYHTAWQGWRDLGRAGGLQPCQGCFCAAPASNRKAEGQRWPPLCALPGRSSDYPNCAGTSPAA